MRTAFNILTLMLLSALAHSCYMVDERDVCCESNMVRFRYIYEGRDVYYDYIQTMECFLFDSAGRFCATLETADGDIRRFRLDSVAPGKYTLVAVANLDDCGCFKCDADTTLRHFSLFLDNVYTKSAAKVYADGDHLYWATDELEIVSGGSNYFEIPVSNIHAGMTIKIEWENLPDYPEGYSYYLEGVSDACSFNPDRADAIGHLLFPETDRADAAVRKDVSLRNLGLYAEVNSLRYTNDAIPVFRLLHNGVPASKTVDFAEAFRQWGWKPDNMQLQKYEISMLIKANGNIEVRPYIDVGVSGWIDGGTIGF
ncbi:MAG: FimB/Mfa2 family fimbrial subunit [Parabacteroides sp.]|nr:FimB/Mfa2 family fimbrial subunit [Parabacteroides sp.]